MSGHRAESLIKKYAHKWPKQKIKQMWECLAEGLPKHPRRTETEDETDNQNQNQNVNLANMQIAPVNADLDDDLLLQVLD